MGCIANVFTNNTIVISKSELTFLLQRCQDPSKLWSFLGINTKLEYVHVKHAFESNLFSGSSLALCNISNTKSEMENVNLNVAKTPWSTAVFGIQNVSHSVTDTYVHTALSIPRVQAIPQYSGEYLYLLVIMITVTHYQAGRGTHTEQSWSLN